MTGLTKEQILLKAFEGLKNRIILDIKRNVDRGFSPFKNHLDEEDFRIYCDELYDQTIMLNYTDTLSLGQKDTIKHQYLAEIFEFLQKCLDKIDRENEEKKSDRV